MNKPQRNHLLEAMSPGDWSLLKYSLEPCELILKTELEVPDQPIEYCYFPISGIVSLIAVSPGGRSIEAGIVGREGVTGIAAILGIFPSPNRALVQLAGNSYRIPVVNLREAMLKSSTLATTLTKFAGLLMVQAMQTALVNGKARVTQRLARWILMVADRSDGPSFAITHEFMATMLAVRRPGVTTALHILEGHGFIRSQRKTVTILDRTGLERFADWTYGLPEKEYERTFMRPISGIIAAE